MPIALDWFIKGSSPSVADLLAAKKYKKALARLRAEFELGNRSAGLRLQCADVLARAGKVEQAVPILLGLASELHAAGRPEEADDVLRRAERLSPGRADIAAKRRAFAAALQRPKQEPEPKKKRAFGASLGDHRPSSAVDPFLAARLGASEAEPESLPASFSVGAPAQAAEADTEAEWSLPPSEFIPIDDDIPPETGGRRGAASSPRRPEGRFAGLLTKDLLAGGIPTESEVAAALAAAEASMASDDWMDVEGEAAAEVLVAQMSSEPSIADIAEMAVEEVQSGKEALVAYVQALAARFPAPAAPGERPGPSHLSGLLFGGLSEATLAELVPGLKRQDFDPEEVIVREGERGGGLYILARGRARVLVRSAHGGSYEIAELGEGSFFGEVSILGRPRTATVMAVGPCETLEVDPETLAVLTRHRPRGREIVEETLVERAVGPEAVAVRSIPAMDRETPAQALRLIDERFAIKVWNPKMRLRLAELLAKTGHYVDVVPVLVGLADQLEAAGQPANALAVLRKISALGRNESKVARLPPLDRPLPAKGEGPGAAVITYVTAGRPAPSVKAASQFRRWVQDLMNAARGEVTLSDSPLLGANADDLLGALDFHELAARVRVQTGAREKGARKAAKAPPGRPVRLEPR
jgi:CRP-like cAMP-binding protein